MLANKQYFLDQLQQAKSLENEQLRNLQILAILTEAMQTKSIRPVLVGGRAVELYTQNRFLTSDTDIDLAGSAIAKEILTELGFENKSGDRYWEEKSLGFLMEIPDSVLDGADSRIVEIEMNSNQSIYVIGIEDLILDRAKAC